MAAAKAQLRDSRAGEFVKSSFFEMEAEMSDDEGHSDDGDDEDANADGMLVRRQQQIANHGDILALLLHVKLSAMPGPTSRARARRCDRRRSAGDECCLALRPESRQSNLYVLSFRRSSIC